jgi:hypothetical protein
MRNEKSRQYLSLILLLGPAILFSALILLNKNEPFLKIKNIFPYLPWQFLCIGLFGIIATIGGILDWQYHRNPLNMKIPEKERDAEAFALGLGGIPMFLLMWFAMTNSSPKIFLIPI